MIFFAFAFRGFAGTLGATSGITVDTNLHIGIYEANGASSSIKIDSTTGSGSWGTNSFRGIIFAAGPSNIQNANVQIAMGGWIDGLLTTQQKNDLRTWAQTYYGTP